MMKYYGFYTKTSLKALHTASEGICHVTTNRITQNMIVRTITFAVHGILDRNRLKERNKTTLSREKLFSVWMISKESIIYHF